VLAKRKTSARKGKKPKTTRGGGAGSLPGPSKAGIGSPGECAKGGKKKLDKNNVVGDKRKTAAK